MQSWDSSETLWNATAIKVTGSWPRMDNGKHGGT